MPMILTPDEAEAALAKALPGLSEAQRAAAVEAIEAAGGTFEEVDLADHLGAEVSIQCRDICVLGELHDRGVPIRAFVRSG